MTRARHPAATARAGCSPWRAKTWTGVPLFLCIGKVDGGKGHGGYGAYNEALARRGYRIKLTSATGKYVIIGSRTIINNERILLANKLMGSELTASQLPAAPRGAEDTARSKLPRTHRQDHMLPRQ